MSVFDTAIAAMFADPNIAALATFVPQVGTNASMSVIIKSPDVFQKVGTSMIETPTLMLEVRVSDCPSISPGDQFQVGLNTYTVQGEPRRDELQLTWQVDVYAD